MGAIPWRLLLSKPPVWALIVSHFCHNWGTFILLTWMPSYYNQVSWRTRTLICPTLPHAVNAIAQPGRAEHHSQRQGSAGC